MENNNKSSHHHHQAYLVVYSLTNASSFDLAKEILQGLPSTAPKFLAANQLDLQYLRQVALNNDLIHSLNMQYVDIYKTGFN